MRRIWLSLAIAALAAVCAGGAVAAEIKVLTVGSYKQVLVALVPEFEKQTGHKVIVENDTERALARRIEGDEPVDLAVLTSGVTMYNLTAKRKLARAGAALARVGIGVMVKAGAPKPDIGSVEAFKRALLGAKSVAYIDPTSGGLSGINVAGLLDKLGIADQVKPKAKVVKGGYVADLIASGEAEIGIHQISEIVPIKEVTLVGPLPAEIQNYTVYFGKLGAKASDVQAALALIEALSGPAAADVLKSKGMEPAAGS